MSDKAFTDGELERFAEVLRETIVAHNISIDTIQRCLPMMGAMRDNGWDPEEVLASVMSLGGDRPSPTARQGT